MEGSRELFELIAGIGWPLICVFELVVAILAANRYPGSGPTLMIVGAVGSLGCSLFWPLVGWFDLYGAFDLMQTVAFALQIAAEVVYLVGVLLLVQQIAGRAEAGNYSSL